MQLEISVLADAVNMTGDGKLNLLGVFTRLYAPSVPCFHPQMFVICQFVANPTERGTTQNVKITLIEEDGAVVFTSPDIPAQIPGNTPDLNPVANVVFQLNGINFQRFGRYSVELSVNGGHVKSLPLVLQPLPQNNQGG